MKFYHSTRQFDVEELNSIEKFDGETWTIVEDELKPLPKLSRFAAVAVPYDKTVPECECVPVKGEKNCLIIWKQNI